MKAFIVVNGGKIFMNVVLLDSAADLKAFNREIPKYTKGRGQGPKHRTSNIEH